MPASSRNSDIEKSSIGRGEISKTISRRELASILSRNEERERNQRSAARACMCPFMSASASSSIADDLTRPVSEPCAQGGIKLSPSKCQPREVLPGRGSVTASSSTTRERLSLRAARAPLIASCEAHARVATAPLATVRVWRRCRYAVRLSGISQAAPAPRRRKAASGHAYKLFGSSSIVNIGLMAGKYRKAISALCKYSVLGAINRLKRGAKR